MPRTFEKYCTKSKNQQEIIQEISVIMFGHADRTDEEDKAAPEREWEDTVVPCTNIVECSGRMC